MIIVTTTIRKPSSAILKLIGRGDCIVIVGDVKTPHDDYISLSRKYPHVRYLTPEYQEKKHKALSDAIGWNKIMRRNIGFVYAFEQGAMIIASIDDDNIPYDSWGKNVHVGKEIIVDCWKSENGIFDPLTVTNVNFLWHRGYPSELIPSRKNITYIGKVKRRVLIQADLWDGIPDIDATNRIIYKPRIKLKVDVPFCSCNISPFNSQNTFIHREALPYYMVLPYIGRMDDIWASYLVQKKFPNSVIYGQPTVYQERKETHSRNINDMKDEMLGYEQTLNFIKGKFRLPHEANKAYNAYRQCFKGKL
jgi:hypothetical protein